MQATLITAGFIRLHPRYYNIRVISRKIGTGSVPPFFLTLIKRMQATLMFADFIRVHPRYFNICVISRKIGTGSVPSFFLNADKTDASNADVR